MNNFLYNSLQQDKARLSRLLQSNVQECRSGIQALYDETCTAIAKLERGEHWTQAESEWIIANNVIFGSPEWFNDIQPESF